MLFSLLLISYILIYSRLQALLPGVHIVRFIVLICAILWLFSRPHLIRNRLLTVALAFIPLMLFSTPLSYLKTASFFGSINFLKTIVMVFLTAHIIDSSRKLGILISTLLVLHLVLAQGTISDFITHGSGMEKLRLGATGLAAGGFLGDANDFALALNIIIPFGFFLAFSVKGRLAKLVLVGFFFIYVIGVVVTFSRSGFLTLVATIASCLLISKRYLYAMVLVSALAVGLIFYAPSGYLDRINTITELDEQDTGYGRLQLWKAGLLMMLDRPLNGVGLDAYSSAYGRKYMSQVEHYTAKWHVAHSGYITMGAELGIFGLVLYLYLMYLIFKENARIRSFLVERRLSTSSYYYFSNALTVSLITHMVGSTFLSACYYPHLYLLVSLTVALGEIVKKKHAGDSFTVTRFPHKSLYLS